MDWFIKTAADRFAFWRKVRNKVGLFVLKSGRWFYVALALIWIGLASVDVYLYPLAERMSKGNFDWLMKNRPMAPDVDKEIVMLDIDEASLAMASQELGRWPWPRNLFATVGYELQKASAAAVVYDILFIDPDIKNPLSEFVFSQYVQTTTNAFFPLIRLNPDNDKISSIQLKDLNFTRCCSEGSNQAENRTTIALAAPYFKSIYDTTRMGTINVQPDSDNVLRQYDLHENMAGMIIPSLPLRLAWDMKWKEPAESKRILNWPKRPSAYQTVSFYTALSAARNQDSEYFKQFAGKIVLIGSTAPTLNDIKATPVDSALPGVYVLAVAIDNLKNSSLVRTPEKWVILLMHWAVILGVASLFVFSTYSLRVLDFLIVVPSALLMIALASLGFLDLLLDLTPSFAWLGSYFAIAKIHLRVSEDFTQAKGLFSLYPEDTEGKKLFIAQLPEHLTKRQLKCLLIENPHIKYFNPQKSELEVFLRHSIHTVWMWSENNMSDIHEVSRSDRLRLQWRAADSELRVFSKRYGGGEAT